MAGILLLIIGVGLNYTNIKRIKQFKMDFNNDAKAFYQSEIKRSESTLKEYKVVFKVIPILIIISALLIIFVNTPYWRAISITTITMLIVILFVDGTAHSRIETYFNELKLLNLEKEFKNN